MEQNVLISIIVPVYNVENYLPRCVDSILAQTYRNLEIILVDDGTRDASDKICDAYAARDSRIRVIHKENGGLSSARNAGIEIARGEYLGFVDSDDWIEPEMYELLLEKALQYDVKLVVGGRYDFSSRRNEKTVGLCPEKEEVVTGMELLGRVFTWQGCDSAAWDKLYHRSLFREIRYPVGKLHEDEAVIHEILGLTQKVAWVDEAHYLYRESSNSITTAKFSLKRLDETYAKEQRIAYFESRGMTALADRTRIVYLNNLMRLYRTVQAEVEDRAATREACRKLHARFCELAAPKLVGKQGTTFRLRCFLFRYLPGIFSYLEYHRLKRKGIT